MNKTMKFLVDEVNGGERIDIYLSKKINFLTRSFIKFGFSFNSNFSMI